MSKISRRGFVGASAAMGLAGFAGTAPPRQPPNVVVFYTDQQRWDTLGCYGNPLGLAPNLDRLASTGVRFERAFTSQPVCAPARSSIQTGKYPTATGVIHNELALPSHQRTLGHYFGQAGYQTGYVGKWHLGATITKPVPLERRGGYDQWWTAADVLEFTSTPFEGTLFDRANRPLPFKKYRVDAVTDLAQQFLARQKKTQPFFLFVSHLEPHFQNSTNTFIAPEGYAGRYRNNYYVPADLAPYPGDWKSQLPDYYGIISRIDECFGRMMKQVSDQGLADNTVVVFTTDHGCHFRTRNREYKRSCHDASIRIPLLIGGPGFAGGQTVQELVSIVDLLPTLLGSSGIAVPPEVQGRSLLPLVQGRRAGWRNEVFVQMREDEMQRAIRTERWKYSVFDPDNTNEELPHSNRYVERYIYDLWSDPAEHVNLVGRPDYRKIADELGERLVARMQEVGEPPPKIVPSRFYA